MCTPLRLLSLTALLIGLAPVVRALPPAPAIPAAATKIALPASDARFLYEGRFDVSDRAAPVVIWQASRIRIDFSGDTLALRFSDVKGQTFFNVEIDGHASVTGLREGAAPDTAEFAGLGSGRHHLMIFKRSEASAGTAAFRGIAVATGERVFAPASPHYKLAMQFFGDSITAGACNEDGPSDQWGDRRTHNNALSYGAMTAAAFDADYRNIAVSGMGVAAGWADVKAGDIWDRVYPAANSPRADLASWIPDVLFVNLGENDDSFTTAKKLPFPSAEYTERYVALVQAIRQAYPRTQVVALRGGMFGGAQSERLRDPWQAAVAQLEASDPRVSHFVFQHWSSTHPRVADHRAMADELIAWLKAQPFMSPFATMRSSDPR